jgi:NADH:ubiquinone oxidoreductase subunit 3 (subunit A)
LFLVFDLELLYLFPWTLIAVPNLITVFNIYHLLAVLPFFLLLILGLIYEFFMNSLILSKSK